MEYESLSLLSLISINYDCQEYIQQGEIFGIKLNEQSQEHKYMYRSYIFEKGYSVGLFVS